MGYLLSLSGRGLSSPPPWSVNSSTHLPFLFAPLYHPLNPTLNHTFPSSLSPTLSDRKKKEMMKVTRPMTTCVEGVIFHFTEHPTLYHRDSESSSRDLKFGETEITAVVCGPKELKKLIDISGQLDTVKRVIYINKTCVSAKVSLAKNNSSWQISSEEEVQKLGQENPVELVMPLALDVAACYNVHKWQHWVTKGTMFIYLKEK